MLPTELLTLKVSGTPELLIRELVCLEISSSGDNLDRMDLISVLKIRRLSFWFTYLFDTDLPLGCPSSCSSLTILVNT